ncbi:DNA/RNA non-specific endonuclease [Mucilaginibacter paludis]|uniref:DNA/RNA non-specific endonuclease n=1 Tax=Mucilaginibacter paludis DSM 18603 TaxID=714943 RepID=H1Y4G7_9SPHI|nr:DNA/RNA non-specific endonuclease [Mucilaginibacter paludis]EHQ26751.1 DNA/RNA non-specific endonuclease [Mucilaginibacter paludis DSM 18603]
MKFNKLLIFPLAVAAMLVSCSKEGSAPASDQALTPFSVESPTGGTMRISAITQTFSETFESGSKTAYAAADVTFSSGSWNLSNALVGTSTSDAKNGSKSVRIQTTGVLSMNFDVTTGASTVTVKHAAFGSDGSSTWGLWMSANGGSSYTQVGSTITTSSTTLATATFTVNTSGTLRFQIRKATGSSTRINIDDFTINSYDSGSGGTGGGAGSTGDNSNMLLGNPSNATTSIVTDYNNYLYDHTYYTQSYNRDKGEPNWTCWYVGSTSLGSTARQDDFRADTNLPSGWYQVGASSYSGSGFDRGHNCPSADRTSTVAANQATFLMDNMVPQAPNNNQQTWGNLEDYGRSLVNAGNEIYVIMGSYGTGGTGSSGSANTVDGGHVNVPAHIWKVIVVLPNGDNDLSRITTSTRVIAVDTPNINTVSSDWTQYITTIQSIENATGYTLLSALPTSVRTALETKVDAGVVN